MTSTSDPILLYHEQALTVPLVDWLTPIHSTDENRLWQQQFELIPMTPPAQVDQFSLWFDREGLALLAPGHPKPYRLKADEVRRRHSASGLLFKALGSLVTTTTVLDAFSGYGLDGLAIASRADVTLVDRHPLICALLAEFHSRQSRHVEWDTRVYWADSLTLMQTAAEAGSGWDIIYLDPMFPKRNKGALPGLGMQHLQALTTAEQAQDLNVESLLSLATRVARQRVVLKRRPRDPVVASPTFSAKGKSVRYDVYMTASSSVSA